MKTEKRTITVNSRFGVHLPGAGRLGKGTHKDVELTADQLEHLEANPDCDVAPVAPPPAAKTTADKKEG